MKYLLTALILSVAVTAEAQCVPSNFNVAQDADTGYIVATADITLNGVDQEEGFTMTYAEKFEGISEDIKQNLKWHCESLISNLKLSAIEAESVKQRKAANTVDDISVTPEPISKAERTVGDKIVVINDDGTSSVKNKPIEVVKEIDELGGK